MNFNSFLVSKRIYLDGAMGSKLLSLGKSTRRAEELSLTDSETILAIHKSYVKAGSDIIYANTFGANPIKYPDNLSEIISASIALARVAVDGTLCRVALSVGSLGLMLQPMGEVSFEQAYAYFAQIAQCAKGVDCVVLETFTDLLELKAAMLAFVENTKLPMMCSMSFDENGRTYSGCCVEAFALTAQGLGASAIGINCSLGADKMIENAKKLISCARVPIFIKPNAGLPIFVDGKECYDTTAEVFAQQMAKLAGMGIGILGGCCGTDEKYISEMIEVTKQFACTKFASQIDAICSTSRVQKMDAHLIVGERINPTGKPLLKAAIIADDGDFIVEMAQEQIADGADVLDINTGMAGIDETEKLAFATRAVSMLGVPLQIDTTRPKALEAALRLVAGVPIINSVNAEIKSMDTVLPLAAKFGAYVVVLCLDENGIPPTAEGRVALAARVLKECEKYNIPKHRLIVDALTMAVSVDRDNAKITLDTMKKIQSQLGLKTTLGLSNVSFGLPQRDVLNANFYALAKQGGLSMAIINPKVKPKIDSIANEVLLGNDSGCEKYIAAFSALAATQTINSKKSVEDCILRGLKASCLDSVEQQATAQNFMSIINDEIIVALGKLGAQYESGTVFLPQLISGAECAKIMLDFIKSKYMPNVAGEGDIMLLATVQGDIHDIGKNIVKAVLCNYGYQIIDLGRDVAVADVVAAVQKYHPKYLGLSALMTTTLDSMEATIKAVRTVDTSVVIMVGGAVVTPDFAKQIGADIYSKDASELAKILSEKKSN